LTDHTSALNSEPLIQYQQPEEQIAEGQTEGENQPGDTLPAITIVEDYRESFVHGDKDATHQKYIVLHDTEGEAGPASVINWWDSNGNLVAAHFIIGKDGTIHQCVPMDKIAHHAGYGDAGHNASYGITEDGRDDMVGSTWVGDWAPDYGMNAWSIGIELVHIGGLGPYPEEQLDALDTLIAYIDAFYGFESTIIDHKAWRSGNSDTSPEFAEYLYNYQDHRRHNA
jgi:N-acetyl-anhydromuramyl-L-alanine amidase AmpD